MVVDGVRVASQAAHEAGVEEEEEDPLALLYHVVLNAPAIKELRFYSRWAGRLGRRGRASCQAQAKGGGSDPAAMLHARSVTQVVSAWPCCRAGRRCCRGTL